MKIAHLCLSCFYIDGYSYQENELVRQNVKDGHDVLVVASTETYGADRQLHYVEPREYMGADGARVIRLPYRGAPHAVARKLRIHPGVREILERERPDVILFHGLCGRELLTAARYQQAHPDTVLLADSHEDFYNSARGFASRVLLHGAYYRSILHRALPRIAKILCISVETLDFVRDFYGVPAERLEFFPLGGAVCSDAEYAELRAANRAEQGIADDQLVFLQSGKMGRAKKVVESVTAFSAIDDPRLRLLLVGHLHDDIAPVVQEAIARDPRIRFLGWKSSDELRGLLCAADVYLQPGTQSATMQMSLCARCAVILDDVPSHAPFMKGNGWLLNDKMSLDQALAEAAGNPAGVHAMAAASADIAGRLLDYRKLAARLYERTWQLPDAVRSSYS